MKGENNHFYGKHHTEETKEKLSLYSKGRKISEETKNKISLANKGRNNPRSRAVQCIETGEILWGAKAFQDKYGMAVKKGNKELLEEQKDTEGLLNNEQK